MDTFVLTRCVLLFTFAVFAYLRVPLLEKTAVFFFLELLEYPFHVLLYLAAFDRIELLLFCLFLSFFFSPGRLIESV